MSSCKKAPSEEATSERACAAEPAIDLVHLSHQTLGDSSLETELLALFNRQAWQIGTQLAGPQRSGETKQRGDLAHMLTGSARAVGAFKLARAAADYENSVRGDANDRACKLQTLETAIEETRTTIAAMLERV
ncbi:MAG: hypothetical protein HYS06_10600 [Methylocystis sp.]|nr:hypothetical protein [Methylocystis sp.]